MTSLGSVGAPATESSIGTFSAALSRLWHPINKQDRHGKVDIDAMVKKALAQKVNLPARLEPEDVEKLRSTAAKLKDDPWITEGRRRFILAGALGEALALRAITNCHDDDGKPKDKQCMAACEAARTIKGSDDLRAVIAAMVLLPDNEFHTAEKRYKGDGWMTAGHFQVPLEGVDLRRKWDETIRPTESAA